MQPTKEDKQKAREEIVVQAIAQDVSAFFLDENAEYNLDTLPNIIKLHVATLIDETRAEEREADAVIAEAHNVEHENGQPYRNCGLAIAAAIRAAAGDEK